MPDAIQHDADVTVEQRLSPPVRNPGRHGGIAQPMLHVMGGEQLFDAADPDTRSESAGDLVGDGIEQVSNEQDHTTPGYTSLPLVSSQRLSVAAPG